jgi:site-specific recombinase XerD
MLNLSRRREPTSTPDPFDRRGYYRAPVTFPAYRLGQEPANKGRKFPPEVLTPEEVFALIDACGRGPAGWRNRALIVLGWRCGLRCAEALDLYPKDVDVDRGRVQVLHGKGDKARVVGLDPAAGAIVDRWMVNRRKLGLTGRQPLLCVISEPTKGRRLHDAYVRELMKKLAERAGIEKRVHFHGLRHSYASYLADRGVPTHFIRQMLGHTSLAVTERYMDHINPAVVVETLRALEWPSAEIGAGGPGSWRPTTQPPPASPQT